MQLFVRRAALSIMLFAGFLAARPLRGQAQGIDELLENARAAQSKGNYADAAAAYSRATTLSPASPELWSNRGVMEYLAGRLDASTTSLKRALQLNPNLFAAMFFLGKACVQAGKPALALAYLNHAHTLQPKDAEVLLSLAKANAAMNRQRQAAAYFADAAKVAPENTAAWFGLGVASLEVITADGRDLADSKSSTWARALYADELLAQGRPIEASDKYKEALATATPAQRSTLARTLEWMQFHPDMFPLPPNSQEALQRLVSQVKTEQGKASLPQCPGVRAKPPTALESAACSYWTGDYQRSAIRAGQAFRMSPQRGEALYWSIKANERIAVAALSRFEELAPHSAESFVLVGDLYRYQRQMDNALSEYRKALAIDARDPAALMGAAAANLDLGNLEQALAMGQSALSVRPDDPQANLLIAETLAAKHEYGQSRAYLTKCLTAPAELQPRVHYLLGRIEVEDGNTDDAIRQFEIAIPGDQDGSIHYQLSRLYRKRGDLAQAQKAEAGAKALIKRRSENAAIALREVIGTNP